MRLLALLFAAVLAAAPVAGAQTGPSPQQDVPTASGTIPRAEAPRDTLSLDLPVSLDKIREALQHPPTQPLRGLQAQAAHFRVEIQERQRIEELLATLNFKTGPTPAGGLYAYEQQRLVRPPVDNPLVQPYAAFNTGELLTIAIENLVARYLGGRAVAAVSRFERERAEKAAREEVARAMSDFCAAQPNHGAGLKGCALDLLIR